MVQVRNWRNDLDEDNNELKPYTEEIETDSFMDRTKYQLINVNGPTQTHGLVTTVPQNIANLKIGDKHTPTRHSLRHSRMVVMTTGGPVEYLPPIVIFHDRAKAIMWIILIVGIIMSFECSGLKIYAPNTKPYLNPFYATLPILFSGIFGFVHLRCCRKEYPGLQRNMCERFIKLLSLTTSFVASIAALLFFFNISIHLLSFFNLDCCPPDKLTETCECKDIEKNQLVFFLSNSWNYVDLSCFELYNVFNVILGLTGLTCLVIVFLEAYYLNLHLSKKPAEKKNQEKNYGFI